MSCHYIFHVVMMSFWFAFQQGDHCKYCIELCYKSSWVVCLFFSDFAEVWVWLNTEEGVPQRGGLCNNPGENSM